MTSARIICILLVASAATLHAQVHELWRSGLTNTSGYPWEPEPRSHYKLTTAAVDSQGNTIVGGSKEIYTMERYFRVAFLAKFDVIGRKVWEYQTGSIIPSGVQTIAVDSNDNLFFTADLNEYGETNPEYPVTLVKLSANGHELWRATEAHHFSSSQGSTTALRVDQQGNVTVSVVLFQNAQAELLVGRFSATGKRLWRTLLPVDGYLLPALDLSKTLALDSDGDVIVAGAKRSLSSVGSDGFIARLDSGGRVEWLAEGFKGKAAPWGYRSILIGPKGTICAAGFSRSTVFNSKGKPLHTAEFGSEVLDSTDEGGFLLHNFGLFYTINSTGGNVRWSSVLPFWEVFGAISDGTTGLLIAGRDFDPSRIRIIRLGPNGEQNWTTIAGNSYISTPGASLLRAPNQTFRLVTQSGSPVNPAYSAGISIIALAIE